ncbi:unnamed protein product, partial [Rotaria sp. Silwood1]
TKQRPITFLKNQSNKDAISLIWHVTNPEQVRHIRIQPVRGKIQPRQSLPIKVTFMAMEAPAFQDIDLVCEIYNETTLNQYNIDLKKWESNIQKKWESFEIDDDEYKACLRSGTLDDIDKQQQLKQNQFQQGSTLQMCKTLPPVVVNYELDETNIDRRRRLRANVKKQLNTRPQMPIPELLHLAFTARTLVYNEYLDLCTNTNQLEKFFIDTCLGGDYRSKNSKKRLKKNEEDELIDDDNADDELSANNNEQIIVSVEEADLLRTTLSDLLRNLLSDRVFSDTLPEMIAEKIPYFSQLQYTRSSKINNEQQQQRQESRLLKDYQTRTNLDEIYTTEPDPSFLWSSIDHENTLNRSELMPKTKIIKRASSTPSSLSDFEQQHHFDNNEHLKNNPNITSLMEDILENTIWNILQEAYHNEFSLTARPRLIALPPKRQSSLLTRSILQTDSNQLVFPSPPLILTESFD